MNKYKREMIYHISSIIYTSIFLITSTYLWFYVKDFNIYKDIQDNNIVVSKNIEFNSLSQVSDKDIDKIESYNFDIQNISDTKQDIKISIVSDMLSNNVSNNYVKYMINNRNIHSLNTDGIIYIDDIDTKEIKTINLKIWLSETYLGNLNYNGRVIVS